MVKRKKKSISIIKRNPSANKKIRRIPSSSQDANKQNTPKQLNPQNNTNKTSNYKSNFIPPLSEVHKFASKAIERLLHADATGKGGASVKSLTLAPHIPNKRAVYAVTVETLKYIPILEKIIQKTGLLETNPYISPATAYVLVRDLLWGDGFENKNRIGECEKSVIDKTNEFKREIELLLAENNVDDITELLPSVKMGSVAEQRTRTVRVNELKMSVHEALEWIQNNNNTHRQKIHAKNVYVDEHIPELLHFPPGTDLHDHPLVQSGHFILQSKASCMTARALDPKPEWRIIDACAAPGNKTTQLAAILSSSSSCTKEKKKRRNDVFDDTRKKIIAFDKDKIRLQRLKENALHSGADKMIDARCADFLSLDPQDAEYSDIQALVLDPSCSGSGTQLSRMDYLLPSALKRVHGEEAYYYSDFRVQSLANFQTTALKHAFLFPNVKKIAYSTCSLHKTENEDVVADVLEDARRLGFELVMALPTWPRRGISTLVHEEEEDVSSLPDDANDANNNDIRVKKKKKKKGLTESEAQKVVRIDPIEDGTDGFFVAVFERQISMDCRDHDDNVNKKEKKKKSKK